MPLYRVRLHDRRPLDEKGIGTVEFKQHAIDKPDARRLALETAKREIPEVELEVVACYEYR